MPGASSNDIIAACLTTIKQALENPSPNAPVNPLQPTQIETLQQLIDIFQTPTTDEDDPAALPRVSAEDPAQLPRVPEKQHRYPTRNPPPLPPARDSAYFVEKPTVPLPPEGDTTYTRKRRRPEDEMESDTHSIPPQRHHRGRQTRTNTVRSHCPQTHRIHSHQSSMALVRNRHRVRTKHRHSPRSVNRHAKRICHESTQCRHRHTGRVQKSAQKQRRPPMDHIMLRRIPSTMLWHTRTTWH